MPSGVDAIARRQVEATIDVLGDSYNGWIVRKCKLVDVKLEGVDVHGQDDDAELRPRKGKARSTVTMDLEVEQGMCNNSGNMHGGCTAFLLDVISSLPLIALTDGVVFRTSGVSQNFNVQFLAPIPLGCHIRIIASTLSFGSRTAVTDCRFEEKATGRLLAFGTHTKVDPFKGPKARPASSTSKL